MDIIPEEERFCKNSVVMIQAVAEGIRKLNSHNKNIDLGIFPFIISFINSIDKHYLIQEFIKNSEPYWDMIKSKDEKFFVENSKEVFKRLPLEKVNIFKEIFEAKDSQGNNIISSTFKEQLWNILGAMIKICIKYIHKQREPFSNEEVHGYNKKFFEHVDINKHAQLWNVKLEF